MAYATVTASSSGFSAPVALDWLSGKPVSVLLNNLSSLSSGTLGLQFTMDDLMLSSSPGWLDYIGTYLSSVANTAVVYTSSLVYPEGVLIAFTGPVAAVRMSVSNISSGSVSMKVIQGSGQ
jgi:hypothetical protein